MIRRLGVGHGPLWVISRHLARHSEMSAFCRLADMLSVGIDVCYVPEADISPTCDVVTGLLDDLSLRPFQGKRHEARLIAGLNLHQDLDGVLVLVGLGTIHRLLDASSDI